MKPENRQLIVGILGDIAALVLYGAPVPTFYRIITHPNQIGTYSSIPYIAGVVNSLCGLLYSVLTKGHTHVWLLISVYSVVLCVEATYVAVFLRYSENRLKIGIWTFGICAAIDTSMPFIEMAGEKTSTVILGCLLAFSSTVTYASPLATIVVREQGVDSKPLALIVCGLISSVLWTLYAVIGKKINYYFLPSNAVGVGLGIIQIGAYWKYSLVQKRREALQKRSEAPPPQPNADQ